eukprot:431286_1
MGVCVDASQTTPFTITVVGLLIQFFLFRFITATKKNISAKASTTTATTPSTIQMNATSQSNDNDIPSYMQFAQQLNQKAIAFEHVANATNLISQGIKKDEAKEYKDALLLYENGIKHLTTSLQYEKNEELIQTINEKIEKYSKRIQDIKKK